MILYLYLALECLAILIAERTIMPVPMQTFTIANKRFTFVIDFIIVLQSRDLNPCTYLYEHSKLKKNLCLSLETCNNYILFIFKVEVLFTFSIVCYNMTIAKKFIFVCNQSFKSYRPSSMKLSCTDTNFSSKAISKAICKSS